MVPSDKWTSLLGIAKFDKVADFGGEMYDFARVEIPLSGHIGAPSVASVSDGAFVNEGDMIAECAQGLSLPQHASISGVATVVNGKIMIDRVR
jgi:Na+-translocating ferredoxin:NAD+ oxidoreductase RnfC subunit